MGGWTQIQNPTLHEQYLTRRCRCGLTLILIPKQHASTFAILGTRFGSADVCFRTDPIQPFTELPDGTAHFLEHKLFECSDGRDALEQFAETGAFANASTSFDKTTYQFSCTEQWERNLEILLNLMLHPHFTAERVQKERLIIGEEIAMHADEPAEQLYFNLLRALYHTHALHTEIGGTQNSIQQITPELLYHCADAFYRPQNMALVICGDLTPEQLDAVCNRILPPEESHSYLECRPLQEVPDICTPRIEARADVAQPLVNIGFKDLPVADPIQRMRICAANAITMQLLFGSSGEFYNRLYESGLISEFGGSYLQDRVIALTEITAICKEPDTLQKRICQEIDDRHTRYFSSAEFNIAKRVVYANNLFNLDSAEDIACSFMQFWQKGGDYLTYSSLLSDIDYMEAWDIFRRTVRIDRCAMSVLYPKEKELSIV